MDKIIRCITSDGAVMASAIDASDIVFTAKKIHHLSRSATAALGRLLCAASIMGAMLKQKDAIINLRVMGGGELGTVVAVSDSKGNVRGYSEQIPTVCALGVLIDKESCEVLLAGGLLIQLLPGAGEDTIEQLEKNVQKLEPVTTMLAKGMSILDICKTALEGFEVEVLDEYPVNYVCTCSREKLERYFCTMSDEDIRSMADEKGVAVANCHFCNKKYIFTKADLEKIIAEKNA